MSSAKIGLKMGLMQMQRDGLTSVHSMHSELKRMNCGTGVFGLSHSGVPACIALNELEFIATLRYSLELDIFM